MKRLIFITLLFSFFSLQLAFADITETNGEVVFQDTSYETGNVYVDNANLSVNFDSVRDLPEWKDVRITGGLLYVQTDPYSLGGSHWVLDKSGSFERAYDGNIIVQGHPSWARVDGIYNMPSSDNQRFYVAVLVRVEGTRADGKKQAVKYLVDKPYVTDDGMVSQTALNEGAKLSSKITFYSEATGDPYYSPVQDVGISGVLTMYNGEFVAYEGIDIQKLRREGTSQQTSNASNNSNSQVSTVEPSVNADPDRIEASVNLGDYVTFGSYYGEKIVWRVINIDIDGNPMLFSDKIIASKAFDSAGTKGENRSEWRQSGGSNLWRDSNLRQWLNSSENLISWIQNPPSSKNIFAGFTTNGWLYAYDQEAGFLSDNNFTEEEKDAILPVTHKTILDKSDKKLNQNGAEFQTVSFKKGKYNGINLLDSSLNYETQYYQDVTDQVFILDVNELYNYVYMNRHILGDAYYATHTASADQRKGYDSDQKGWGAYWLRTPNLTYYDCFVKYMGTGQIISGSTLVNVGPQIYGINANHGQIGLRPALVLKAKDVYYSNGDGSSTDPFYVFYGAIPTNVNVD